jgi:Flp pilus assembly secretin CpaC
MALLGALAMRTLISIAALCSAVICLSAPAAASAQAIRLNVDQSKPLNFKKPITGVVVGNAGVADVIVHDSRTLLVIGKSVGSTHFLVVDEGGREVFSGSIAVDSPSVNGLLTVQRGRELSTSICDSRCVAYAHPESGGPALNDALGRAIARNSFARGGGSR